MPGKGYLQSCSLSWLSVPWYLHFSDVPKLVMPSISARLGDDVDVTDEEPSKIVSISNIDSSPLGNDEELSNSSDLFIMPVEIGGGSTGKIFANRDSAEISES